MKKTRTISIEWEDRDYNERAFEIDVPADADEDTVDDLVEKAVFDEAVSYFNWHEGSDDEE
ncbi:hypothetical protein [Lactobacillus helveticus]|uniref:hypothetical protein n=1 Tax=Lactobacillus helveticus TaxID=1587 RepID=UPI00062AC120|nr:hypothetical protein [Lactobacillus helveticus]AKG66954.1 hypothetical protein TU99_06770 [Lactobacillus helveticus]